MEKTEKRAKLLESDGGAESAAPGARSLLAGHGPTITSAPAIEDLPARPTQAVGTVSLPEAPALTCGSRKPGPVEAGDSLAWEALYKSLPCPALTPNAVTVLESRYLRRSEEGELLETPKGMFFRVARAVAGPESRYGATLEEMTARAGEFYDIMARLVFMPNSPTLMNAGRSAEPGLLSACFVLPVGDSIEEIFDAVKATALIQKAGGGTGFAFDRLRPTGDFVTSSGGQTSGPISFWKVFSEATRAIQQGAFRRGANMGMMSVNHPDILKFIFAKQDLSRFTNYNISVKVTDEFMEGLKADPGHPHVVRNPRTGLGYLLPRNLDIESYRIQDLLPAEGTDRDTRREDVWTHGDLLDAIVDCAWRTGEPGVVFIDRMNEANPTPHIGRIEATNPCGEQPLLPYEACNLGSINLGRFVESDGAGGRAALDWDGLREVVHTATRFLDDVVDAGSFPLIEITEMCRNNRKIGLGVMGLADALFRLRITYDSAEGVAFGEKVMKFINDEAHIASERLAEERGLFPNWEGSTWDLIHHRKMRNACCTTVAPTGTVSIIADCSSGIEPLFSLAFFRNVLDGKRLVEVNGHFERVALERGFHSEGLMGRLAEEGSLREVDGVPDDIKRTFVCAHDVAPEWHIKMQAAFQRHNDSSISKTINFSSSATREDVRAIYEMAYGHRLKGVTVYRDGCRADQPMALAGKKKEAEVEIAPEEVQEPSAPRIAPVSTPAILSAVRIRQTTPFGHMHLSISVDPRTERELEVFAQLGKGGDVAASDLEAICRMVSLFLRSGGSLELVVDQLDGIGSSMSIPTRDGRIMSLGDGIAKALQRHLRAKNAFGLRAILLGEVDVDALVDQEGEATRKAASGRSNKKDRMNNAYKIACPECRSPLVFEEGCTKCHGCGYSQC